MRQNTMAMKEILIGREAEKKRLLQYVATEKSEFIALYGRRRVGKTFLVKQVLGNDFSFSVTGMANVSNSEQLKNFQLAMQKYTRCPDVPTDWLTAFSMLEKYLGKLKVDKKIIFIDEMPWMDGKGSGFISALEHFWNSWAAYRNDIKLIVCGSATSWILNKIIKNRGGLHNRVTHQMLVSPFTLRECASYFKENGFGYAHEEIAECYMALGGIPYYLSLFEQDKSVAQNIDNLCFMRGAELSMEFNNLYSSLFKKATKHIAIVSALATKGMGMTRLQLLKATKSVNNGNFTATLRELEQCEFIRSYTPFGKNKKDTMYQLIDPFTLFHFRYLKKRESIKQAYWSKIQETSAFYNWCGYAFEILCLHHIEQILKALSIAGINNTPCSWSISGNDHRNGAQIDLLIDRADKTINICEMKYTRHEFEITKEYDSALHRKMDTFKKETGTRKSLMVTMIASAGLVDNMYSRRLQKVVTLEDLFQ